MLPDRKPTDVLEHEIRRLQFDNETNEVMNQRISRIIQSPFPIMLKPWQGAPPNRTSTGRFPMRE